MDRRAEGWKCRVYVMVSLTSLPTSQTKNDHTPPPEQTRKSSQSVNALFDLNLVSFPVLSKSKPQAPRLVVNELLISRQELL